MKKINHCAHCLYEPECAVNNWMLYDKDDPCCPNMIEGRKQYKQFLKEYLNNKYFIEDNYHDI